MNVIKEELHKMKANQYREEDQITKAMLQNVMVININRLIKLIMNYPNKKLTHKQSIPVSICRFLHCILIKIL